MVPLRERRVAAGLSREVLGAKAGLSPRTIYGIEVEGVRPTRATRVVLAMALGCEVHDLFAVNGEAPAGETEAPRRSAVRGRDAAAAA